MEEVYKKVVCNDNYEISNYGNLRRLKANGEYYYLKGAIQKTNGYKFCNITDLKTKKRTHKYFHNLVLLAHVGERPKETKESGRWVCDHKNRNKLDNRLENLRWVTETENLRNTVNYNTEIATTDKKERLRALRKWRIDNPNRVKKRRKRGTGYIKKLDENSYWIIITVNGKRYKKTVHGTYEKANQYADFIREYYTKK